MKTTRLAALLLLCVSTASAQGGLLVYEGFDYTDGELAGKGSVGYGLTGTWFADVGPTNRKPAHTYRVLTGATSAGPGPWGEHWDGKLTHLPQTGLFAGGTHHLSNNNNFDWADHTYGDRKLDGSITGLLAANVTTWMSCATVYIGHNNHYKPMIAIGAGVLSGSSPNLPTGAADRGRHATGQCIGMGAIHNSEAVRGIYWNDDDMDPNGLHERLPLSWTTTLSGRTTPMIMIAMIEWDVIVNGNTVDRITVARFDDSTSLTKANWNAAPKSVIETTVNLDQSKFDTLSFSGSRYYLDEIRIGTTFDAVTGYTYVQDFAADTGEIEIQAGGTQKLTLNAGPTHANADYWIFGSVTGTSPGVTLFGVNIPLNVDPYTDLALGGTNSAVWSNFRGKLDSAGSAVAAFNVPGAQAIPVGLIVHHAYVVLDQVGQVTYASNPVGAEFK